MTYLGNDEPFVKRERQRQAEQGSDAPAVLECDDCGDQLVTYVVLHEMGLHFCNDDCRNEFCKYMG